MAAKKKSTTTSSAWGIIIGLTGIPVVALLMKIFPGQQITWDIVLGLFVLLALKSLVRYVMPRRSSAHGQESVDASHAH
jgi:hypothetical protein